MARNYIRSTRYSGVPLVLLAFASSLVGARALDLSYAQWCSDTFCDLRLFTIVGGELVMVDSGSSAMAYCEAPNPIFVTEEKRVFENYEDRSLNISQCQLYGGNAHGWYGDTYEGMIEFPDGKFPGIFTVMRGKAGLSGNQCGPIFEGSIGLENSTIGGIMGIGIANEYTFSNLINTSTWTETLIAAESGDCCTCPGAVNSDLPSGFVKTLSALDVYQLAITWDGTIGEHTGKMLFNEEAEVGLSEESLTIKVPMDRYTALGRHMWATNVTSMALDGVLTNITQRTYVFDTGTGYISLPEELTGSIKNGTIVTFVFPTMEGKEVPVNVTVTQELIDTGVFRYTSATDPHFFGLNFIRYVDNCLYHFHATQPYFQAKVRETPILELPAALPLGKLAGPISNKSSEIDTTDANFDLANVLPAESVASTIWNAGMSLTNVALAVATLTVALF